MAENFRRAGALRERLHCQKRGPGDDGWGGVVDNGKGPFENAFASPISAGMRPRTGGEEVTAARLSGQQPYIVTVRNTSRTRQITTGWQLVDARNADRVFAITSPPADPDGKNQWLEFIAVEGKVS
ncbi:head-tail adaptor protein [Devosia sp. 2618]|uniref:head-tail adaptor protein n=1 Tax=Devosia sp. 2618 TaxID=3156454 RepID=UPI003397084F